MTAGRLVQRSHKLRRAMSDERCLSTTTLLYAAALWLLLAQHHHQTVQAEQNVLVLNTSGEPSSTSGEASNNNAAAAAKASRQDNQASDTFGLQASAQAGPFKFMYPTNTLRGLAVDLNNVGAQFMDTSQMAYSNLATMAPNRMLQAITNRYTDTSDELVRRAYELLANPQQVCAQLAQLPQQTAQSLSSATSSLASSPAGSYLSKLTSSPFSFGR